MSRHAHSREKHINAMVSNMFSLDGVVIYRNGRRRCGILMALSKVGLFKSISLRSRTQMIATSPKVISRCRVRIP